MILLKYMEKNKKKIYSIDFYHVDVALSYLEDLFKNYDLKCFSLSYINEEEIKWEVFC